MKIRPAPDRGRPRNHSDEYTAHLASEEWRATRALALRRAGHVCQTPGCEESHALEVHHATYARLGAEAWGDLTVLCPDCHAAADARRRGLGRLR
jgi:5-methylcytosine-specific restriction endonuclease McrA